MEGDCSDAIALELKRLHDQQLLLQALVLAICGKTFLDSLVLEAPIEMPLIS